MKRLVAALVVWTNLAHAQVANETRDRIITQSVMLDCSQEIAFSYFSDNHLLQQWLAPKADIEMKPGGKYELFWSPEDKDKTNNSTFGCKVLAVDAPNYFNMEWRGNKDHKSFMNNVRPLTNVTVVFTPINASQTKVSLLHTGWREGKDWDGAFAFFEKAWANAFKELESKFKNETSTTSIKLFCYYLKLNEAYKDPASWTDEVQQTLQRHAVWMDDLGKEGKLIFAGRTLVELTDENLFGIAVVKAKDIEEATKMMSVDPAVVAGIQKSQVFPYTMAIRHPENLER
ncbi:MAG: SRPBCC domain-containing protein [Cyclobacteriaceae bacterium]